MEFPTQPPLRYSFLHPARTTPQTPQNLLRVSGPKNYYPDGYPGPDSALLRGIGGLGDASLRVTTLGQYDPAMIPRWVYITYGLVSLVGYGVGAYHGWKRTEKAWPTIGYSVLTGILPIIGYPVIFAQGFARRKRR